MTEPHIYYPKYAKNIKCKECAGKLEICAFLGFKGEYLEPILSCYRCGAIATLEEYKLKPEDIAIPKEQYDKIIEQDEDDTWT